MNPSYRRSINYASKLTEYFNVIFCFLSKKHTFKYYDFQRIYLTLFIWFTGQMMMIGSVNTPANIVLNPDPVTYNSPGTYTFTVPAGVTQITVDVWGAGGRGGSRTSGSNAYGGGGGGAYSQQTIQVTGGQTYTVFVGQG
ncbi:MAG TPA: hypothetical protein PKD51_07050, partial [Saprospiraceae bacterium]|nr:hypothetical protein [Saprospiraceae bacterium]